MTTAITLEDSVAVTRGQIAADVGGELVILSIGSGEYFGLNEVGSRIWSLIGEPRPVHAVRNQLLLDYPEVDSERCTSELLALLADLHDAGLVEISEPS